MEKKQQQAFPTLSSTNEVDSEGREHHAQNHYCNPGMTLRDWFAGQALAAGAWQHEDPDKVADWAYQCADAMMKARGA